MFLAPADCRAPLAMLRLVLEVLQQEAQSYQYQL